MCYERKTGGGAAVADAPAAAPAGAETDPLLKALNGQPLTREEQAAAGEEVAMMEEIAGEPPPEIAEKLKAAGVEVPPVGDAGQ